MSDTTVIVGIVVTAALAVVIYEAGRSRGAAGVLEQLQKIDHSTPTLNAIEALATSVPGTLVRDIVGTFAEGYKAVRPFVPDNAKNIADVAADIAIKVTDGKPNEEA